MQWTIDRNDWRLVRDDSSRVVCYADTYQIAAQIVMDHNKNDFLTEDQKQAIRDERANVRR